MKQEAIEHWIKNQAVKTELTDKERDAVWELLDNKGFKGLIGLMFAARQAQYAILATRPLGTAEHSAQAAVIQGVIKGIELFFQTVIEQGTASADTDDKGAKK